MEDIILGLILLSIIIFCYFVMKHLDHYIDLIIKKNKTRDEYHYIVVNFKMYKKEI